MSKQYLDKCFYCDENKEAVKAAQRKRDSIICGEVDSMTGELLQEIKGGRHTFVVTDKERKAYEEDLKAMYNEDFYL